MPTSTGDPIADQFASIHDMFGASTGPAGGGSKASSNPASNFTLPQFGGGTGSSAPPLTMEPTGGQDSLTVQLRNLLNLLGGSGQDTLNKGGSILDTGLGVTNAGIQDLQDPLAYWSKILSGDKQAMTEATAPEAAALSDSYAAQTAIADTTGARGGYRSSTLANLPFAKARDIGDLQQKLRPEAATNVTAIGNLLSQLGISEQGIGLGEQGVGLAELQAALQGYLARRGQNIQETGNNLSFISNLLGTILGSKGVTGLTGGGSGASGGGSVPVP